MATRFPRWFPFVFTLLLIDIVLKYPLASAWTWALLVPCVYVVIVVWVGFFRQRHAARP